jgi:quercetin dioxygenase-like cupin family protein
VAKTIFHPAVDNEVVSEDWGELTWFASAAQGNSAEITVGRCVLRPGQSNPRHSHPNCSEVLVVIEGSIEHAVDGGGVVKMGPGDTITVAPDFIHRAKNLGQDDAVMFIAFSSARRETKGE